MKIDKRNPSHWLALALFGMNVLIARIWRSVRIRRPSRQTVVLYGHKLAGNLQALHAALEGEHEGAMDVAFLTMDRHHHRQLRRQGVRSVLATSLGSARLLAGARAIVSDHGLHAMKFLLGARDLAFFDVWHGIPFKGFDSADFRVQHRYDEAWVASPFVAELYVKRFGFDAASVHATGYARTDRLVRNGEDRAALRQALGIDADQAEKVVLFAPTWKQDARKRSIYPFDLSEEAFLAPLSALAVRQNATFVMRAHLNSSEGASAVYPRVVHRPYSDYPDTEALLLASDVLVCDWSSIAFDWLLLARPTVFLDVPAPFAKGFSLGPEFRFGEIVHEMAELVKWLEAYLLEPSTYIARHGSRAEQVRQTIYADCADGHAAMRCVERLRKRFGACAS